MVWNALANISPHSTEWRAIRAWATAEIDAARDKLETHLDERSADRIRGRIQALRDLLQQVERPAPVQSPAPDTEDL